MINDFGDKINLLLAKRNMTNVDLARELNVKPPRVARIKRTKNPRPTTVHRVAKAFKVSVDYFFN